MTYVEAGGGRPDTVAFRVEDCGFVDIAGSDQTGEGVLVSGGAGKTDVEPGYLWSTYAIELVSHCSLGSRMVNKTTDLAKTSWGTLRTSSANLKYLFVWICRAIGLQGTGIVEVSLLTTDDG